MKAIIKISVILTMFFFAGIVNAQPTISLDSILQTIQERNPMIRSYKTKAAAMNTYAKGASGWLAPEVGGGLWMVPYKRVSDERDKGQIMISAQQKFTNPAKVKANRVYLESKASIEEANGSYVFNELRYDAKLAYVEWMTAEMKRAVLQKNEEVVNAILQIAEQRYAFNQSKLGSIYKATARLATVQNMILVNENQIVRQNIRINQLMNTPTDIRFRIDTTAIDDFPLDEMMDTVGVATRRSDVRRIDNTIQSMRLNQLVEDNQSKPDFSLSFNHMIARGSGMPNQFMLLGMISIPIAPWSSKSYHANSKGIGKEIEALREERASLVNEFRGATVGLVNELHSLSDQRQNYERRILPALKKNYESVMLAYRENKEDLPEVLEASETLVATQLQYWDIVQKYLETIISYEKEIEK